MIHCRPETEAWRSRWIEGRATFTIVLSRPTMNRLMQQIARISRRRRWSGTAVSLGAGDLSASRLVMDI
ncbi:hypothetical protein GCM10023196_078530 [Actinoallomurus vinaceus]|uniref:Uncharacterized protein n=1 Tax=Actinoallomurus vinaceus TaxID=1080074 RepID=A0ABP8UNR6_9ACTN